MAAAWPTHDRGLDGLAAAASHQNQAQHGQGNRDGHGLLAFDRPVQMLLRYVGDFVRHHTGHFVFVIRRQYQAAEQGNHTTRGGKGVDDI